MAIGTQTTVEVPTALLVEVAGFLDALDVLATRLEVDREIGGDPAGRAMSLITGLCFCVPSYVEMSEIDDDTADDAYNAHPVNVGISEHSKRVVDAFMDTRCLRLASELDILLV